MLQRTSESWRLVELLTRMCWARRRLHDGLPMYVGGGGKKGEREKGGGGVPSRGVPLLVLLPAPLLVCLRTGHLRRYLESAPL